MTFKLPLLAPHDATLQKCVYCPKLSRAACPISNVEANETVTPWGKMSMAYFAARGDVPLDADHAEPAWACSACYACRERCEHKNEVASVLADARADLYAAGFAPEGAWKVAAGFGKLTEENRRGVRGLDTEARKSARVALLIGCSYVRHAPDVAAAIWRLTASFVGAEVRAIQSCCGLPLLHAGDRVALRKHAAAIKEELQGAELLLVADPGCARALISDVPAREVGFGPVSPLIDLIYARLDRVPALALAGRKLRYHDPCQLGRGLGRYDEPRAVLARLTGRSPEELPRVRAHGECSGAGGILPVTRPETARAITAERVSEHRTAGGGTLVSGCGASLRAFRAAGEPAVDLMTLVAEACP